MSTLPLLDFADSPDVVPLKLHKPSGARLIVIVPALNEQHTIADVIRRIPQEIKGVSEVSVVVVDDGSTDRTLKLAHEEGATVVRHSRPGGVGAAFQSGLRRAFEMGADLIVSIDGDGQFNPEDIPALISPVLAGEADFATASRFLDPSLEPKMPWVKRWGNRQVSRLISYLTGSKYYDVSCGMRVYNRNAALSLSLLERFTYTHEVFLHLTAKKMTLVEVPIRVRGQRQFGTSRVARSIVRYAFNTLKIIFRFYRDYHPLQFFGGLALLGFLAGAPLLGFCLVHYFSAGTFSPHKWAGFLGVAFWGCGVVSLMMAVLGDMLSRQRVQMEEILFHARSLIASASREDS